VENAPRPTAPAVNDEAILAELKAVTQLVGWRYTFRKGRWTKPPVDCRTGRMADVAKAGSWPSAAKRSIARKTLTWGSC
jgi:hypothetical protein